MHILFTRPFDDCYELILRFKSLGHMVSHIPVISIQKIIYLWMLKYPKFKKKVWETSTLSSRMISWMLNIDIIIKTFQSILAVKIVNIS